MDQTIGRYQVLDEIGAGGMAKVYLAFDPRFEREVAIKILPPDLLDDPSLHARFAREAKVVASLEHPAIVPVHDFGEEQNQQFLVMRYLRGGSLKDRMEEGPLSFDEISGLTNRLAGALDAAHSRNVVHRDIKPANILFDEHDNPYLSDFGIVKLGSTATTLTGQGVIGTPAYMSPEQARGASTLNLRSDIYSLGVLVFELLAGRPPFEADTPMGLAVMHVTDPVPNLTEIRPDLPPTLDDVLQKALAKRPEDRYDTAGEFATTLTAALAGEKVEVEPAAPPTEMAATLVSEGALEQGEPAAVGEGLPAGPPRKRRRLALGWLIGGGLAVVLIALGFFGLSRLLTGGGVLPTEPVATVQAPLPTTAVPPDAGLPPVEGPAPNPRVAAFYYPWYGNPTVDGRWVHWDQPESEPPEIVASDYYPVLGAYSSNDPVVVAQHFAWLRQAGVGVIVSSWWGEGDFSDEAVPLLLEMAERYGLKIAFHIENYEGRGPDRLLENIGYLYDHYGEHPAFYRTREPSRWSDGPAPRGLFFLWDTGHNHGGGEEVGHEFWIEALDELHSRPEGAIVLALGPDPAWVTRGHFDGLYTYADLDLNNLDDLAWSGSVPAGAWYVPTVLPGFRADRIGYEPGLRRPRNNGQRYQRQWDLVINGFREPQMVTITSFNEWHEGSQIEPASEEPPIPDAYRDFSPLSPTSYLDMTREWSDRLAESVWPEIYPARFTIRTTSDWTSLFLVEGGNWIAPQIVAVSEQVGGADLGADQEIHFNQPIDEAMAGQLVELTVDVLLTELHEGEALVFRIERGSLGMTEVELFNYRGDEPILVESIRWAGLVEGDGTNPRQFAIPAQEFIAHLGQ